MVHVNALSRIVAFVKAKLLEKELQYKQLQDSKFKDLSAKLERENHHKFELLGRVPLAHVPIAHVHTHARCLEFFHWITNQKILF